MQRNLSTRFTAVRSSSFACLALAAALFAAGCGQKEHDAHDGHDHATEDHAHSTGDGHDHAADEHAHSADDGHDHSQDDAAKKNTGAAKEQQK
jgi:hypothetical protein